MSKIDKHLERIELMIKRRLPLGEDDQKMLWTEYLRQKELAEGHVRSMANHSPAGPGRE